MTVTPVTLLWCVLWLLVGHEIVAWTLWLRRINDPSWQSRQLLRWANYTPPHKHESAPGTLGCWLCDDLVPYEAWWIPKPNGRRHGFHLADKEAFIGYADGDNRVKIANALGRKGSSVEGIVWVDPRAKRPSTADKLPAASLDPLTVALYAAQYEQDQEAQATHGSASERLGSERRPFGGSHEEWRRQALEQGHKV